MKYINQLIKKKLVLTFYFVLFTFYCSAQDSIRISGQFFNNTKFAKVVVQKFGLGVFDIAAVPIDKETGAFTIIAPLDVEPGVYRFRYNQTEGDYVDIILNGKEKEVEFSVDVALEGDKRFAKYSKSLENRIWQNFEQQLKAHHLEINVLDAFISVFPNKKDAFYLSALKERTKKVHNYQQFRSNFIKTTPYYYAKQLANYTPNFFPNPTEDFRLQDFYKYENFWKGKTTTEESLLNTPLYTDAILAYLKYYMNPEMAFSEEEMNVGFKKSVDTIMNLFSGNEKTQEFAIKYLQLGFKELGNEEVLKYIDEKYASLAQCTTDDSELQKRLKGYETLKIGNLAPEIVLTDSTGTTKSLKDYPQEDVIVVFWASWCPHCMEEMPKLNDWAISNPNTLVLAISLDEDFTAFQEAIKKLPNMVHNCDLQKWNGKIVKDYYVAATPTFFKLDKEREIVGKYVDVKNLTSSITNK